MMTDASRSDTKADLPRAGFWRRWLATVIDMIVVMFPFQVLAAMLFAITAGAVQMNSGFFNFCEPATTVPQALAPPPPHDSNFATVCRVSFFGATTGATLTVGRSTREGNTTTTVSQGYMLDKDGNPTQGTSIDGIVWLAFLVYLVVMIWKTGRPLGARAVKIRVVNAVAPGTSGVPLRGAIIRYLAMAIGVAPAIALFIYRFAAHGGSADAMFAENFFQWFKFAAGLWALWAVVLTVQVARKRDPVYDRLAGTAVVRDTSVVSTEAPR
jgi:hypothetical protein